MDTMINDYERTKKVILSCKNLEQLKVAVKMFNYLSKKHLLPDNKLDKLENLIGLMRIKLDVESIDEGLSNVGKEFKKAAMSSGISDLKGIRFSESTKKNSVKEIAEKHKVSEEEIKKEISIGTMIEMEHTDDKNKAKKIAIDHILEIPDYYTDTEYGIIAIEDKQKKSKKSLRVNKKEIKELEKSGKIKKDGVEILYKKDLNEDLDYNDITQSLRDQLKQKERNRFSKDQIFDIIRKRKEEEHLRIKKEIEDFNKLKEKEFEDFDDDTVEEATGASSSGQFVGRADGPIKKLFSKIDYNNEVTETISEEDNVDEATGASSNAIYATSPWGKSKFMLTDKGPGKVPVKTTQPDMSNLGYQKVRVKEKCKTFPYCNQSPEAIEFYNENRIIKKNKLKLKYDGKN